MVKESYFNTDCAFLRIDYFDISFGHIFGSTGPTEMVMRFSHQICTDLKNGPEYRMSFKRPERLKSLN